MSLSACMNDEFRTGTDLVNGEDMVIGETSFPVKAWTVPDPVRDTLSARVEADIVYQIGDPVNNNKKGYNFCMLGNYSYPGVCSVEAGFAVQLQVLWGHRGRFGQDVHFLYADSGFFGGCRHRCVHRFFHGGEHLQRAVPFGIHLFRDPVEEQQGPI